MGRRAHTQAARGLAGEERDVQGQGTRVPTKGTWKRGMCADRLGPGSEKGPAAGAPEHVAGQAARSRAGFCVFVCARACVRAYVTVVSFSIRAGEAGRRAGPVRVADLCRGAATTAYTPPPPPRRARPAAAPRRRRLQRRGGGGARCGGDADRPAAGQKNLPGNRAGAAANAAVAVANKKFTDSKKL